MIRSRARIGFVCVVWLAATGCEEPDRVNDGNPPQPSAVRQKVEGPAAAPAAPKPGLDQHGRLLSARDLVAGFEVPMRAKLKRTRRQYLELELQASDTSIEEFYSGIDRTTRRRYADRGYAVQRNDASGGFSIRHTPSSLGRLKLDDGFETAHISIRKRSHWNWTLRVYDRRDPSLATRFKPDLSDPSRRSAASQSPEPDPNGGAVAGTAANTRPSNPSGASGSGGATVTGKPSGSPTTAKNDRNGGSNSPRNDRPTSDAPRTEESPNDQPSDGRADFAAAWDPASAQAATAERAATNPKSTTNSIDVKPGQKTFNDHETGRYGPYPPTGKRNIRERVRRWQVANPGKTFLD